MSIASMAGVLRPHLRTGISACVVLALIYLCRSKDPLSDISRPVVIFALQLFGTGAIDGGDGIKVGRLDVPWTRDCAGLNAIFMLLALTIWTNRREPAGLHYWIRLALAVPAAFLANVLRALSIVAYRSMFFPQVESPELHYFLGLVWLFPFLVAVIPRGNRPFSFVACESVHAAAVLALLATMGGTPGGDAVGVSAILCLCNCRIQTDASRTRIFATSLWAAAGAGIALAGVESFWLPWLLACPMLLPPGWMPSLTGILLIAASHPLIGMLPGASILTWGIVIRFCVRGLREFNEPDSRKGASSALPASLLAAAFVFPFAPSFFDWRAESTYSPPADCRSHPVGANTFEIKLPAQPDTVGLLWFEPTGRGRHHTLQVCMKYRGIDLRAEPSTETVMTDGERWMMEYFLVGNKLLTSYREYILHTLRPGAGSGVHLVVVARCGQMNPAEFRATAQSLAFRLCAGTKVTP